MTDLCALPVSQQSTHLHLALATPPITLLDLWIFTDILSVTIQ